VYHLKDVARHNLSINVDGKAKSKTFRITDANTVSSYLHSKGAESSAIGVEGVGAWSQDLENDAVSLRASIVQKAAEPVVEPKDEWDIALDSGMAYPKRVKSARERDPFGEFDRDRAVNAFQDAENRKNGFNGGSKRKNKRNKRKNNRGSLQKAGNVPVPTQRKGTAVEYQEYGPSKDGPSRVAPSSSRKKKKNKKKNKKQKKHQNHNLKNREGSKIKYAVKA